MTIALLEPIQIIKAYIASGVFPGASFAFVDKGKISKHTFGNDRLKPEIVSLKPDMAYDLASVSKVVGTGTVLIDLILSGQVALDALLTDYYPEFEGQGAERLTIRQLVTHTSGINPFIKNRNDLSYSELRAALNRVDASLDKVFHYSDVNFILLGFMLEAMYHKDLSAVLQDQVFKPFNMTHTGFIAPEHTVSTAWELPKGVVHDPKARVLGNHTGSAGLFSTLDDLVNFSQAYFEDDRYLALLKDYSLTQDMRSISWDILKGDEANKRDVTSQWLLHTGYTGTFVMINLKTQQAVIFLSNRVHLKDDRPGWIMDRNLLINSFVKAMQILENR